MIRSIGTAFIVLMSICIATAQTPANGKDVFEKNCALCHNPTASNRTPTEDALRRLPNSAILTALETGSMKAQGSALSAAERQAVAGFLAAKTAPVTGEVSENTCPGTAPPLANVKGWNG
jgi:polyvinyl alcohol dehydrogenase (cytochrome)